MAACCLLTGEHRRELRELISLPAPLWECTSSVRNSTGARKFATRTFPMQASLRSIRELTRCRYASASECLHALAETDREIKKLKGWRRRLACPDAGWAGRFPCFARYLFYQIKNAGGTPAPPNRPQLELRYAIFSARLKLPRSLLIFSCSCRIA